jgi:hypothetical protein
MSLFVVFEGIPKPLKLCSKYANQDNWLSDWFFVEADSVKKAYQIASLVCKSQHPKNFINSRCFKKLNTMQTYRTSLLDYDLMTPEEILNSTPHQATLIFNQNNISQKDWDV